MTGGDIQDLMNDSACIAGLTAGQNEVIQTQLLWLIFLGGGGGTGAVCLEGDNYCFSGTCPNQVFKVKNLDTGLANRLDTIGADGLQTITTDVGSSC